MSENPPSDQGIFEKIDDAFKALDEQRSEDLKKLVDLQAIKNSALKEEHERLTRKLGSDHPRVKMIAVKLAHNEGIQESLESVIDKANFELREYDGALATDDEKPISLEPDEGAPTEAPDTWIVRGAVIDEEGIGIGGLIVSLYDKDLIFDDVLGTTATDRSGYFKIMYRTEAFRDLFEERPDLYLKVTDNEGNELYTSKEAVWFEAGRIETFNVTVEQESDDEEEQGSRRHE